MRPAYGPGNLGNFIGPAGLALIAGSSNFVSPKATVKRAHPGRELLSRPVYPGTDRRRVHQLREAQPHDHQIGITLTGWPTESFPVRARLG